MDSASECFLIQREIADLADLPGPKNSLTVITTGGDEKHYPKERQVEFLLRSLDGKFTTSTISAATIPLVSQPLQGIHVDPKDWPHLRKIKFSESLPLKQRATINLLAGEPWFSHLDTGRLVKSREDSIEDPIAHQFKLGWALSGMVRHPEGRPCSVRSVRTHPTSCLREIEDGLGSFSLENFWKLDVLGISSEDSEMTLNEQRAWDLVAASTSYNRREKRWTSCLPFREGKEVDFTNTKKALAVMYRIHRKYSKNPAVLREIDAAYEEFLDRDFSEVILEIPTDEKDKNALIEQENLGESFHVLESHPVFTHDLTKQSHKLRLVLNCASVGGPQSKSINDFIYPGPCLLKEIPHIIIRFRMFPIAYSCDIQKCFLNIRVKEDQRRFLHYVWQFPPKEGDPNKKGTVKLMRFKSTAFGVISSPFVSNFVIRKHCELFERQFPEASAAVKQGCYVDDIVGGAKTEEEAKELCKNIHELMALGSFSLHKYVSNSEIALEQIPQECKADSSDTEVSEHKILGIRWLHRQDLLYCGTTEANLEVKESQQVTKREVLASVSSCWDPNGILSPYIITGKILMQKIWQLTEVSWDTAVPEDIVGEFLQWKTSLPFLKDFTVKRCIVPQNHRPVALMLFGDASTLAYGGMAYLLSASGALSETTKFVSSLIFAKGRVAPLKPVHSIPRLEMLAALVTARISHYLKDLFPSDIDVYHFSDSEITLYRLAKDPGNYKLWLGNRCEEILEKTAGTHGFFWCSTDDMPADWISRGKPVEELIDSQFWLTGPKFIKNYPFQFQKLNPKSSTNENQFRAFDTDELKRPTPTFRNTSKPKDQTLRQLLEKYEHFATCVKVLAFILRFCRNAKSKPTKTADDMFFKGKKGLKGDYDKIELISASEKLAARKIFYRIAQNEVFGNEIALLKAGEPLPKNHELRNLLPYFDNNERLLRMNSRLRYSELLSQSGNPFILPKRHPVTEHFVRHLHKQMGHCSLETTIAIVRRECWITSSRREIKRILHGCVCHDPVIRPEVLMSPLPSLRADNPVAWRHVSCDFFGPLLVKTHAPGHDKSGATTPLKVWGLIWSDAMSRCVELRVCEDLTTETFICMLRQLISRRGKIETLLSDNAKTFQKSDKELRRVLSSLNWTKIQKESNERWDLSWVFSASKAPWYNSLSERLISSSKRALKSSLAGTTLVDFLELSTIFSEVESFLNSRPLGIVSDSPDSPFVSVSPAELAIGRRVDSLPFERSHPRDTPLSRRWATRKRVLQMFWKRWVKSYLLDLSVTKSWISPLKIDLKVGQYVQIRDDPGAPIKTFRHGVITQLFNGKDGNLRRCELRTLTPLGKPSLIMRDIRNLAIYEHDAPNVHRVCLFRETEYRRAHVCNSPFGYLRR